MNRSLIPNLITLTNLLLGCIAIVCTLTGRIDMVPWLIFAACWADFFDGLAARILKVSSPMGLQLDSLADMVTFGVVPGIVAFKLLEGALNNPNIFLLLPGFLITLFAAYRLAKFNVDTRQTSGFLGMATPAATGFIVSLIDVQAYNILGLGSWVSNPFFLYTVILLFSFLLVSEIPMFSLKFKRIGWHGNEVRYIFMVLGLGLFFALMAMGYRFAGIPFVIALYFLISIVDNILHPSPSISSH